MSEIKINIYGNTLEMQEDSLYSADKILAGFYEAVNRPQNINIKAEMPTAQIIPMELDFGEMPESTKEKVLKHEPDVQPGVEHDIVAIYDNAGIPSIMRRFRKITNKELFDGSDKTHSAFVIGGEEYDEIYISVYENCNINGKPYSLPLQKPWTSITNDEAAKACASKGEGWHLMTRPEWGLLANLCSKAGVFPHGNTNYGKYHADREEKGILYNGRSKTLTGSGPASWTHDHTPEGVHDLCGNVWEEVRGFRIKDGVLQRAKDNDGAMDIDLSEESENWVDVLADNGKPVRVSVDHQEIVFTAREEISEGYEGVAWGNVKTECESEQLKELGLYPGESNAYCYIDSTEGERLPLCGGRWTNGATAGVFTVSLHHSRSHAYSSVGFRSAYFRKTAI